MNHKFDKQSLATKFAVVSDLHLEQYRTVDNIPFDKLLQQDPDCTLIVAGDVTRITPITQDGRGNFLQDDIETPEMYKAFLSYVANKFFRVILICGNHEFYSDPSLFSLTLNGTDMDVCKQTLREWCEPYDNITFLDNQSINIDGIAVWGGTLWSELPPCINLGYPIWQNGVEITSADYNRLHESAVDSIRKFKSQHMGQPQIIISHHAPTFLHFPPHHMASRKRFLYGTDLTHLFEDANIDAWIAGHTHQNYFGMIHRSVFVCNSDPNKPTYDPKLMFTVNRYDPMKMQRAAYLHRLNKPRVYLHLETRITKQALNAFLTDIETRCDIIQTFVGVTTGNVRNRWTDKYNDLVEESVRAKTAYSNQCRNQLSQISQTPFCARVLEFGNQVTV